MTNNKQNVRDILEHVALNGIKAISVDDMEKICELYIVNGEYEKVIKYLSLYLNSVPQKASLCNLLGSAYMGLGQLYKAANQFQMALSLDRQCPDILQNLQSCSEKLKIRNNLPGIYINSFPYSGSFFVATMLARGLGLPKILISPDAAFPHDQPGKEQVQQLAQGSAIAFAHLLPSKINLSILDHYLNKLVLQIRDPRQVTLSSTYSLLKQIESGVDPPLLTWVKYFFPKHFLDFSFEKQLDWCIEYVIPDLISMLEGWMAVNASQFTSIEVLIVQFEKFKQDAKTHFENILDFYRIPHDSFVFVPPSNLHEGSLYGQSPDRKSVNYHFRKGSINEWMDVFTHDQKQRATELIPPYLLERFGWPLP